MKHAATLNVETTVKPDNADYKEHQVTLLISGPAPEGSTIALERRATGSDLFLPVTVLGEAVVFTPDNLLNDTVTINMQIDELRFVPNATFTAGGTFFGYKIISRRS